MWDTLRAFGLEETGATAVEYGLIVGLIALAGVTALTSAGNSLGAIFGSITNTMNNTSG